MPIPNIEGVETPASAPSLAEGMHRKLYRFSPDDYKEIGSIWTGDLLDGSGPLEVMDGPPTGGPQYRTEGVASALIPEPGERPSRYHDLRSSGVRRHAVIPRLRPVPRRPSAGRLMPSLDWRWVGLGAAIMFGLSFVAGLLTLALFGSNLPTPDTAPADAAAAIGGGRLALAALVSFASFAIGGYIVGLKSPGRTIVEPGVSAAIAVALGLLIGGAFTLGNLLAGGLVPFLAGLLGGYLGERRQASAGLNRP